MVEPIASHAALSLALRMPSGDPRGVGLLEVSGEPSEEETMGAVSIEPTASDNLSILVSVSMDLLSADLDSRRCLTSRVTSLLAMLSSSRLSMSRSACKICMLTWICSSRHWNENDVLASSSYFRTLKT